MYFFRCCIHFADFLSCRACESVLTCIPCFSSLGRSWWNCVSRCLVSKEDLFGTALAQCVLYVFHFPGRQPHVLGVLWTGGLWVSIAAKSQMVWGKEHVPSTSWISFYKLDKFLSFQGSKRVCFCALNLFAAVAAVNFSRQVWFMVCPPKVLHCI